MDACVSAVTHVCGDMWRPEVNLGIVPKEPCFFEIWSFVSLELPKWIG